MRGVVVAEGVHAQDRVDVHNHEEEHHDGARREHPRVHVVRVLCIHAADNKNKLIN